LSTITYTFGIKTIKLSVEYPKSDHQCRNEKNTITQINSLIENLKKENYYYTGHEITGFTNTFINNAAEWNATTGVFTATKASWYSVSANVTYSAAIDTVNTEYGIGVAKNGNVISNNRIFVENNELVKRLAGINSDDVSLVALLGADIEYKSEDRNLAISRLLNDPNTKLPGTSKFINDAKLTPREEDIQRQKNILWQRYNAMKDVLESKITDGRSFRAHGELGNILETAAKTIFRQESQEWFDDYSASVRGDNSYTYGRAYRIILNDPGFMKKNGQTEYWQDVKTYMNIRSQVTKVYNSFPDGDERKALLKEAFLTYIETNMAAFHPKLQTTLKIYFINDSLKAVD
jgi:hypothetical protein